jgi:hypothetical protein
MPTRRNLATLRILRALAPFVFCVLFAGAALAHDPSKSYLSLTLESNQLTGQWDIPLRDLQTVNALDLTANGFVTYEKLHAHYPEIISYATARLKLTLDGGVAQLRVTNSGPVVEEFADGSYLELPFVVERGARGPNIVGREQGRSPLIPSFSPSGGEGERTSVEGNAPKKLEIAYQLFFDINSLHRGLLRLESNRKTQSSVFTPDRPMQRFNLAATSPGRQFLVFLQDGVWHIWTGYDHILFLLALLLPLVLEPDAGHWRGVNAFRPAFMNIFKIVTAFTVAHSLTLSLATLGVVRLPSRLTESAIAASVVLAAANNLWPLIRERGWMMAFGFGLGHGFGFATALSDLGLVQGALALTLVGFNLGVEAGQLAIVAFFLPIAFISRRSWWYQTVLLRVGSALIILIAGMWFAERVFNFKVLPF